MPFSKPYCNVHEYSMNVCVKVVRNAALVFAARRVHQAGRANCKLVDTLCCELFR